MATNIETQTPRDKHIGFIFHITLVLLIAVFCLLNLTVPALKDEKLEKYWVGLLGSCIGYLLPNPSLKTLQ